MDGQGFSREVAFSQSVINIGADQGNDIVLRGSSVADFHVLMHYDSGRWSISPLNGAYRTTVNGRSLDVEGTVLQNGSIVEIGTYRLTMMLNGVNTDIIIQSQSGADASMSSDSIGTDQNIQLEITKMDQTELEAGTAVEMELTVTNAGPLVANMQLQLQGIPSAWVQIIPPVLNLNEGRKGTFLVRISPPRNSSAQAGLYNMHFVAISPNYPQNTGIADTSLTILPYSEFLISGPAPMQLKLSRGKQTDIADVVVINSSNATGNFFIQSRDDSNELNFAYQKTGSGGLAAGQEMVTVRPGDSVQIPMEITAKKIPLLGVSSKHYHYYTNVTPSDRPGDAQTIAGEVVIKPTINTMVLLLLLALLIIAVGFIFQPYIHSFECQEGRRSQVIVAGNAAQLSWNVSGFASTITLNNGQTDSEVSNNGTQYVSPTVSTTYTITAENFISSLLHLTHKKTVQVLVVPSRPAIDVFSVDKGKALYDETVTLNWSVEPNATAASITSNKATTQLAAENYTGKLAQGYQTDTLISLKAQNDSGYDLKSLFVNVASDNISLVKFTVWVRPNGIAIPEDNDVRRTTRWGSLQLTGGTEQPVRSGASGVNPQPAAQSNTLEIPDNYNSTGAGTQLLNPEVMAAAGQPMPSSGTYSYQPPAAGSGGAPAELLVSPSLNPTPAPTAAGTADSAADSVIIRPAAVPTGSVPSVSAVSDSVVVRSTAAPAASPEGASPNRDFTIKLAEVIEDPLADSGYRVISYYPNYVLQKQEQILVEWNVDGVSKVKIENLSGDDLQNVGGDYAYPEKSTTYTLTAQVGETKKAYSLPVNVAGDSDDGEGSGLKCDLKANAATLKVPGSVMLTWTGGGNNRVQLISSTQAEKENDEAEKKKEEEAKAKGEKYEKPKQNQPLTGGTIGDYLQPSGFMRVNVDKQTTFVLNAYDASNNVICTKSVEVKYEGGNDKKDIKLKITKIADENGVSQPVYGKGQMVSYTVALTDFVKGTDPTGAIAITDGTSTCSVNWPVNTCSFQAKKTGELTITAVYAGDDVYKKATATAKETVVDKMPTSTQINSAIKPAGDKADVEVELLWDAKHSYGMVPGGTVTLTAGSTSCDVDMDTETMTCAGEVTVNTVKDDGSIYISVKNMGLKDATPDRVTAAYKGDAYFRPSTSQSVLFRKVNTQISIVNDKEAKIYPYKPDENHANLETLFNWVVKTDDKGDPVWGNTAVSGRTPTGTITYILTNDKDTDFGKCVYDLTNKEKPFSCEGTVTPGTEGSFNLYTVKDMLLANPAADRVRAEYSGDSIFNASKSATVLFEIINTELTLSKAVKSTDNKIALITKLKPESEAPGGNKPTGTIVFTSGAATCTLDISDPEKLEFDKCSGTVTIDTDGNYKITEMEMKGTPSDSILAEYSGDSSYDKSSSASVKFETKDTQTVISNQAKSPGGKIYLETEITWDGKKSSDDEPTGTIVFTSGSATCTLNLSTLKFEACSGTAEKIVPESGEAVPGVYRIAEMQMAGTPGDTIYAKYSGDGFYKTSTSESKPFERPHTGLKITSITDESGIPHEWYTPKQKYFVLFDLSYQGDDNDPEPTGNVTIEMWANGIVLATQNVTLPSAQSQLFEIPDTVPDDEKVKIVAKYPGDTIYSGSSDETTIPVKEKLKLTPVLTVTDKDGKPKEEYAMNEPLTLTVVLQHDLSTEFPTQPVSVINRTNNSLLCTINYPQTSCKVPAPGTAGSYEFYAVYPGYSVYPTDKKVDPYFKDSESENVEVKIDKYDVSLVPDEIMNQFIIKQPYYVYNRNNSTGQKIRVSASLVKEGALPSPSGKIYVKDKYNPGKLAEFDSGGFGLIDAPSHIGEYELTFYYDGDSNYPPRQVETTVMIQNMIQPILTVNPAYRRLPGRDKLTISFSFVYTSPITDEVSPFKDCTEDPACENNLITFTIGSDTYTFDPLIDEVRHGSSLVSDANIEHHGSNYVISNLPFTASNPSTVIKASYGGNRYFYSSASTSTVEDEGKGYTFISLDKTFTLGKSHAIITADFSFDKDYSADHSNVKPNGTITLKADDTVVKTCTFDLLSLETTTCGSALFDGVDTVHFEFTDIVNAVFENAENLTITYSNDANYRDATYVDPFEVYEIPPLNIPENGAKKTSTETADLVFTVNFNETEKQLAKQYDIFTSLILGSGNEADPSMGTCRFDLKTLLSPDGCSADSITYDSDTNTYTIKGLEGLVTEDDTHCSVTMVSENYLNEDENPTVSDAYVYDQIKTTLTLMDVLKYNNVHAYLTFKLDYDNTGAAFQRGPTGVLHFVSLSADGNPNTKCYFNLEDTDAPECGDDAEFSQFIDPDTYEIYYYLKNVEIYSEDAKVSLSYNGDDLYMGDAVDNMPYTSESPQVQIQNVVHNGDLIYSAFNIKEFGSLAEKYDLNNALRFTSYGSGTSKSCDYRFSDSSFSAPCSSGSLTIDGDKFVLKGLSDIFTAGDTEFSVSVFSDKYPSETVYSQDKEPYEKIKTSIKISRNSNDHESMRILDGHVFLKADLTYTDFYGIVPSGIMTFSTSGNNDTHQWKCQADAVSAGQCVPIEGDGYGGTATVSAAAGSGKTTYIAKNLSMDKYWKDNGSGTSVRAAYSGDDIYAASDDWAGATYITPNFYHVRAEKYQNYKRMDASFDVAVFDLVQQYDFFNKITVRTGDNENWGQGNFVSSSADIPAGTIPSEFEVRSGDSYFIGTIDAANGSYYNFKLKQWRNRWSSSYSFPNSYTYFWAALESEYLTTPWYSRSSVLIRVDSTSTVTMSLSLGH